MAADRQFETQAAIVRVMKQRKSISHAELVAEVIKATRDRGAVEVGDIKKNIDKYVCAFWRIVGLQMLTYCARRLIEKEYMERGEGNSYEYLA